MSTDLSSRLDALGRSLAGGAPAEPPAAFMQGVQRAHTAGVVKAAGLWAGVAIAVAGLVVVAARTAPRSAPPVPAVVDSPDQVAPQPSNIDWQGENLPRRMKDWRKELLD
jgi:hypothetical protein